MSKARAPKHYASPACFMHELDDLDGAETPAPARDDHDGAKSRPAADERPARARDDARDGVAEKNGRRPPRR